MAINVIVKNAGQVPEYDEKGNELPDPKKALTLRNPDGSILTVIPFGSCFGMAVEDGETSTLNSAVDSDLKDYQNKKAEIVADQQAMDAAASKAQAPE